MARDKPFQPLERPEDRSPAPEPPPPKAPAPPTEGGGGTASGPPPPPPPEPPAGEPRVIPEMRRMNADGTGGMLAVRMADYPAEKEKGWARWKVWARIPFEAGFPPVYLIAPDEEAARKAYAKHQGLESYPVPEGRTIDFVVKRMED